jgi:hypothetical protein
LKRDIVTVTSKAKPPKSGAKREYEAKIEEIKEKLALLEI